MEEMKSFTYRAMATYHLGVNVRTDDDARMNGISEDDVLKAAQAAARQDRTVVFEMKSGDDPMEVLGYCNLASRVYGAEYIFIDHVQRLAYLGGIEGATNILTKLAANLAQLAKEMNVGIIMISHVNEDGHTKYAKSLEEEAIICIRIERDKEATDEEERNTTRFFVEKNRPFSKLGLAGAVYYDPETTLLSEVVI
jgi:replicative DNA helicase